MSTCVYCGKEITHKSHHKGREPKYCNIDCYYKMHKKHQYGTAVCFYCGKEFLETRDRPNKFCSTRCSTLYNAKLRQIESDEENEINPETAELIQNAEEEMKSITARLNALYDLSHRQKRCGFCGRWFTSTNGAKYCSEVCAKKANNYRHDHRLTRNGKADYTITLPRVYDRDNGVCQMCGEHLSFDCHYNDGKYPTIDHIVPLSKGGLHRWDNVQLLCRTCNIAKSDSYTRPPSPEEIE